MLLYKVVVFKEQEFLYRCFKQSYLCIKNKTHSLYIIMRDLDITQNELGYELFI